MKNILLVISIIFVFILLIQMPILVLAENKNDNSEYKLEYNDTTIVIDIPVSLDAYLICYDKNNSEIWHTKLYSYEYISGITMELQRVGIVNFVIENNTIKITDSRNVIYFIDPKDGNIIETNTDNYTLPDFSNVSAPPTQGDNDGVVKYLAIFFAFIGVGLIVYIASRNKK